MGNEFGLMAISSGIETKFELRQMPDEELDPEKLRKLKKLDKISISEYIKQDIDRQLSESYEVSVSNNFGLYNGQMKDKFRHGMGVQNYTNSNQNENYFGQFELDKIQGMGACILENDTIYLGEWKDGAPQGLGMIFGKENFTLYGNWLQGYVNGQAIMMNQNFTYYGDMKDSIQQGYGVCYYNDGTIYKGQWNKGSFHGFGQLAQQQLELGYEGDFYMNMKQGKGIQYERNGSIYYGDFLCDKKHGFGVEVSLGNTSSSGIWYKGNLGGIGFQQDDKNDVKICHFETHIMRYYDKNYIADLLPKEIDNLKLNLESYVKSQRDIIQQILESKKFQDEEEIYLKEIERGRNFLMKQQSQII